MRKQAPTLEQFARIVRTNRNRLKRLYDDLAYARYLMYATQGISYDRPRVQSSPVFDKIAIDLDRIDRIEKKIAYYESMDSLWERWQKIMTPRETDVFHRKYMQDKRVVDIAFDLSASEQRIYLLINKLEEKWQLLINDQRILNI